MSEPVEPTVCALIFDQGDHPCPEEQLMGVYALLEQEHQRLVDHPEPEVAWVKSSKAELATILAGRGTTPDQMHRHLLNTRRRLARHCAHRYIIAGALESVRRHSTLYTPRSCWCAQEAWIAFRSTADAALGGARSAWSVTDNNGAWSDLTGDRDLTLDALLAYTGRGGARDLPKRIEVHIETPGLIRLREGGGRRMREWTLTRLTDQEEIAAARIRYSTAGTIRAAGSWVRRWNPQLLAVFSAWTSQHRGSAQGRILVDTMNELGVSDLGEAAGTAALRLIPEWRGSLEDLVSTAVAIGGAGPAQPTS